MDPCTLVHPLTKGIPLASYDAPLTSTRRAIAAVMCIYR